MKIKINQIQQLQVRAAKSARRLDSILSCPSFVSAKCEDLSITWKIKKFCTSQSCVAFTNCFSWLVKFRGYHQLILLFVASKRPLSKGTKESLITIRTCLSSSCIKWGNNSRIKPEMWHPRKNLWFRFRFSFCFRLRLL